jgi:hypothetical protein
MFIEIDLAAKIDVYFAYGTRLNTVLVLDYYACLLVSILDRFARKRQ